MSDIIERLRGHPGPDDTVTVQFRTMIEQRHEAAAEIERLKTKFFEAVTISQDRAAEIERLKAERNTTKRMLEDVLARHGLPRP